MSTSTFLHRSRMDRRSTEADSDAEANVVKKNLLANRPTSCRVQAPKGNTGWATRQSELRAGYRTLLKHWRPEKPPRPRVTTTWGEKVAKPRATG